MFCVYYLEHIQQFVYNRGFFGVLFKVLNEIRMRLSYRFHNVFLYVNCDVFVEFYIFGEFRYQSLLQLPKMPIKKQSQFHKLPQISQSPNIFDHQYPSYFSTQKSSQNTYSKSQIFTSITILHHIIPQIFTNKFTNMLIKRIKKKIRILGEYICNDYFEGKQDIRCNQDIGNDGNQKIQWKFDRKQELKQIQQNVARIFCQKGYGLQHVLSQENTKIGEKQYNRILYNILTLIFRKLQQFLKNENYIDSQTTTKQYLFAVYKICSVCHSNFHPNITKTLSNTIKCVYNITPYQKISLNDSIELYSTIQSQLQAFLNNRKGTTQTLQDDMNFYSDKFQYNEQQFIQAFNMRRQQSYQLHSYWNQEYQQKLLFLYRNGHKLIDIKDIFIKDYPQNSHLFTLQSLRSKLYKMMRGGWKKILSFIRQRQQLDYEQFPRFDQYQLRNISYHGDARQIRLLLIKIYEKDFDVSLYRKAIDSIHSYNESTKAQVRLRRRYSSHRRKNINKDGKSGKKKEKYRKYPQQQQEGEQQGYFIEFSECYDDEKYRRSENNDHSPPQKDN